MVSDKPVAAAVLLDEDVGLSEQCLFVHLEHSPYRCVINEYQYARYISIRFPDNLDAVLGIGSVRI
jgi:hypothetical protein